MNEAFIFSRNKWIGEATLSMEKGKTPIPFFLSIDVRPEEGSIFSWAWEMHNSDLGNMIMQYVSLTPTDLNSFNVRIENEMFGIFEGQGYQGDGFLGYEIHNSTEGFSCIEHFTQLEDGFMQIEGEYLLQDTIRMHLNGRVTSYETVAY